MPKKSRRVMSFMASTLCSALDGRANAAIRAATTDIARHRRTDVGVARVRIGIEQRGRRHDLTRLAVAALNDFLIQPGLLHFRAVARRADCLDCRDLALTDSADRRDAGADRLAVQMNRAGTAQRHAAAALGPGHYQN